jgi:integrase
MVSNEMGIHGGKISMETVQPIRELSKIRAMKNALRKSGERDYMLFCVGINTGLRISDILNLRVSDVRGKTHIHITEQKTGKDKKFKINNALKNDLEEYVCDMNDCEYLFQSHKGKNKPITRVQAYRILNDAAQRVGLSEIGTHTLRKTFGYHFYKQYKDVALLQELFNHSAPSVTLRYIGINQDIMDKAMDDFGL